MKRNVFPPLAPLTPLKAKGFPFGSDHSFGALFKECNHDIARYRRKFAEECVHRLARLDVVEQCLNRNLTSSKHRRAPHDFGVNGYCLHDYIL